MPYYYAQFYIGYFLPQIADASIFPLKRFEILGHT